MRRYGLGRYGLQHTVGEILTVFGVNWKLMAIQMVNFGLLLLLLHRFLYKPILRILEQRRAIVVKGIEDAKSAEEKLRAAEAQKHQLFVEATHEAERIVEAAKSRAQDRERTMVQDATEKGKVILADAGVRAEEERRRILQEGTEEMAKIAVLTAEKILRSRKPHRPVKL